MTRFTRLFTMAALALAAVLLCGCSFLDRMYGRQVVEHPPAPIATNVVLVTNIVLVTSGPSGSAPVTNDVTHDPIALAAAVETARTNAAATLQTRITPRYEIVMGAPTYTTNLVDRPEARAVIQGTEAIPVWGGAISAGLGLLYSGYRNVRNRKVKTALVESVEQVREFIATTPEGQKIDARVKEILKNHQVAAGVWPEVEAALKRVRG